MNRGESGVSDLLGATSSDRTLGERLLLCWDFAIVVLVCINLALILFDTLFVIDPLGNLFGFVWPAAHDWYARAVHQHFATIDLAFVGVFVLDVAAGWVLAIAQRRYYRWFFYPFVHWYDVLGCIPVSGFRFLRALRVISILMRLQRLAVIDIRGWWLYRQFMIYYDIAVEEISDRVVVKMLSGVQDEMKSGGQQLSHQIVRKVVEPRRQQLVDTASAQIEHSVLAAYDANRDQIQAYVSGVVGRATSANPAFKNLERMPMLGSYVARALDTTICDTVNQVLDEAVAGLSSPEFEALVANTVDSSIDRLLKQEDVDAISSEIRDSAIEVLELVKAQASVQHWREHFE